MANTYTFSMTAQQIALAAIRKTGAYEEDDLVPPEKLASALEALNVICKDLTIEGAPLWCTEDIAFLTQPGVASYNISTIMGMPLPPRIMYAYIRTLDLNNPVSGNTGNDVNLILTSRYDYDTLGRKDSPGVPNQAWYDLQLGAAILTLYDVPNDNFHEIHIVVQRQIADVPDLSSGVDFPQEAARMLIWQLLDELAMEYQLPPDERKEVNSKAVGFKDRFFDSFYVQEQVSVTFTPSERNWR